MATKKTTAKDKVEKLADIVEDKVRDTVEDVKESTKEVAKEAVNKAKKAVSKKDMKTTFFVEYHGKQVEDKVMIAAAKKAWTNSGHKVADIKTIELYVKPEEAAVYYVINKAETGKVEF